MLRHFLSCLLIVVSLSAFAEDKLLRVPVRPNASMPVFWMPRENATATVMLMPGGGGGFGQIVDGKPSGQNFLVRSREYFIDNGFNVAIVGRVSDQADLDYAYRVSDEHVSDLRQVIAAIRQLASQPVWMVGTSRGTVSTTAAAIAFGNEELAGIVLTSSVVNRKKIGAVPAQKLDAIHIPVLILHHEKDECIHCRPHEVQWIMRGLDNAPVKKLVMASGGSNPSGDLCEALHWHGFIGMEKQAVELISAWIKMPTP